MRNIELIRWFGERFKDLDVSYETNAYIVRVFHDMTFGGHVDMSNESVVLAYAEATNAGNFEKFQRIGDWCVWVSVMAPQSLVSPDVVTHLGAKSYETCDRLMMKRWLAFNELATRLPNIVDMSRRCLNVL